MRNNNPLNIRKTKTAWAGKTKGTDPDFETFRNLDFGIRAAYVIIRRYIYQYGLKTLQKIIYRWAPPSENNSLSYVIRVRNLTGFSIDDEIDPLSEVEMSKLLWAMHIVENGKCYISLDEFQRIYAAYFPVRRYFDSH